MLLMVTNKITMKITNNTLVPTLGRRGELFLHILMGERTNGRVKEVKKSLSIFTHGLSHDLIITATNFSNTNILPFYFSDF